MKKNGKYKKILVSSKKKQNQKQKQNKTVIL